MKICLINAKGPRGTMRSIPHGLMQIQADMKRAGHEADIWDYNLGGGVKHDESKLKNYDLIGLSAMSTQLPHAMTITETLPKGHPVVWGGVHANLDPASILNRFPDHFVISGEGEIPLLSLLEGLEQKHGKEWLAEQPGISFREKDKNILNKSYFHSDINELADVNYKDLPYFEMYLEHWEPWFGFNAKSLPVLVSRGCFWNCNFCINALYKKQGGNYRAKSFDKIRRETSELIDEYHFRFVEPRAEDLFGDRKLLAQWEAYAQEKNFLWCANARFNYLGKGLYSGEDIKRLSSHGFYNINMAVEAGCEQVRNDILNKKVTDKDIKKSVEIIQEIGKSRLAVGTSFVTHFPGDTPENRIEIIKLMDYLSKNTNILFSGPQIYRPYPGSKLYQFQEDKEEGNLDFYLDQFDEQGTPAQNASSLPGMFWGEMLMRYFNRRYEQLRYPGDQELRVAGTTGKKPFSNLLLSIAMAPIWLRLKLNFWGLFVDPYILPIVYRGLRWVNLEPLRPRIRQSLAAIPILKKIKQRIAPNL